MLSMSAFNELITSKFHKQNQQFSIVISVITAASKLFYDWNVNITPSPCDVAVIIS